MSALPPAAPPPGPVLVMGAGLIGGYLGGLLATQGVPVDFVGRLSMRQAWASRGLHLTDTDGLDRRLPSAQLRLHEAPPAGCAPALALLCVKTADTADAAALLGRELPPGTPVLSCQNGLHNVRTARRAAPGLQWLAGMVPFNVSSPAPGHLHRGTRGTLMAERAPALADWPARFARAGLPMALRDDMPAVQWAKLLLNLNNPVNALSGLPLQAQLLDPALRACTADLMAEALDVLARTGVRPARLTALPARWLPPLLRLPTPLFRRLAAAMLRIDPLARSSMAEDLARGRPTEVDALCGEVLREALRHGLEAPRQARMLALVQDQPARGRAWTGAELRAALDAAAALPG